MNTTPVINEINVISRRADHKIFTAHFVLFEVQLSTLPYKTGMKSRSKNYNGQTFSDSDPVPSRPRATGRAQRRAFFMLFITDEGIMILVTDNLGPRQLPGAARSTSIEVKTRS